MRLQTDQFHFSNGLCVDCICGLCAAYLTITQTSSLRQDTSENVEQFSAVGYFFAKSLYEKYQVPIGLIRIAVGGSPAEAWLSESTIKAKYPNFNTLLEKYKNKDTVASIIANDRAAVDNWNKKQ